MFAKLFLALGLLVPIFARAFPVPASGVPAGTPPYTGNYTNPEFGNFGILGTEYLLNGFAASSTLGSIVWTRTGAPTGETDSCPTTQTPCWLTLQGPASLGNVGIKINDNSTTPAVLRVELFLSPTGQIVLEGATGTPGALLNPLVFTPATGELDVPGLIGMAPFATAARPAVVRGGCYFDTTFNHITCGGGTAGAPVDETPVFNISIGNGVTGSLSNGTLSLSANVDNATISAAGGPITGTGYWASTTAICGVQSTGVSCGPLWVSGTAYASGATVTTIVAQTVRNYSSTGPCTAGITAPSGTGTGISDGSGGCSWNYNANGIGAAASFNAAGTFTAITVRQTGSAGGTPNQVVDVSQKGAAGGVATLGGTVQIPIAQIPVTQTAAGVAGGADTRITGAEQTANKNATNGYAGLTAGLLAYAQMPVGTTTSHVAAADDSRIVGAVQSSSFSGCPSASWTPTLAAAVPGTENLGVSAASGCVSKGPYQACVEFTITFTPSSYTGASGNMLIGGLPYAHAATGLSTAINTTPTITAFTWPGSTAGTQLQYIIGTGASVMTISAQRSGGGNTVATATTTPTFPTGTAQTLSGAGCYITAS